MQILLEKILDKDSRFSERLAGLLKDADRAGAGAVFDVRILGGEVGEIINIEKVEGGFTINKRSRT